MRTGIGIFVLALLVVSVSRGALGDDVAKEVIKISDLFKGGKTENAEKAAAKAAKPFEKAPDEVMGLFRNRDKGGIGWGRTALKDKKEDGLEKKLEAIAKKGGAPSKDEAAAAEQAGYDLAALAEVIKNIGPAGGKKKGADWEAAAKDMRTASLDFAKAAAKGDGVAMQKAAAKANASCAACHAKYK